MRKLYILSLLLAPLSLLAQNVEFEKSLFKDRKSEFKEAVDNIEKGDQYYLYPMPSYSMAIPFYEAANKFNPENGDLNFKIGMCYINSSQKFRALPYFEKAYRLKPAVHPEIHFYIGRGLHLMKEWDKAISEYETFKKSANPKESAEKIAEATKKIQECNYGKRLMAEPVRVWIDNLGNTINSEYPEYGMIMNADATEIYFTSRRPNTTGEGKDEAGGWFEDIYMSKRVAGKWTPATRFDI